MGWEPAFEEAALELRFPLVGERWRSAKGQGSLPRFFFNVHDGTVFVDEVGTELGSEAEARFEALRYTGQLLSDDRHHLAFGQDWMMEVTDARGLVLMRLDVQLTAAPILAHAYKRRPERAD